MTLTRIQNRRGTAAQWIEGNPVLAPGEIGLELDTGKFKIGTGTLQWSDLSYGLGSAYDVAVANGFSGTEVQWLDSLVGQSAYEIAVSNGFVGTEADWLNSLIGPQGLQGTSGFTYPSVAVAANSLTQSDAGKVLLRTSTSDSTIYINTSTAFTPGQHCVLVRNGPGQVTIASGAGVTIRSTGNRFKLDEQYSAVTILCVASNEYILIGDLKL